MLFFIRDLCCSFTPPFLLLFLNWFSWLSKIIIFPMLIILLQINGKVGDFLQTWMVNYVIIIILVGVIFLINFTGNLVALPLVGTLYRFLIYFTGNLVALLLGGTLYRFFPPLWREIGFFMRFLPLKQRITLLSYNQTKFSRKLKFDRSRK